MKNTIIVVGAGLSGLIVARKLADRGARVIVLEKSRGLGGRMATKRLGDAVFDHGAQYFTVRGDGFSALRTLWENEGVVKAWPGTNDRRWIGNPGMTAVAKSLAAGLEIEREHKVTAARHHTCGCWELDIEDHGIIRAERLVLTAPLPQSLSLLQAGDVVLPEPLLTSLKQITYHPCLALLLISDAPSRVPDEGVAFTDGPLRWIADNVKKGISNRVPAALTVHASAGFAEANYGKPEAEVAAQLMPAIRPWIGEANVTSLSLHRWKFSEPRATYAEPFLWLEDLALGFAGDAFGGPRIEGAATSGMALGDHMAALLKPA